MATPATLDHLVFQDLLDVPAFKVPGVTMALLAPEGTKGPQEMLDPLESPVGLDQSDPPVGLETLEDEDHLYVDALAP